MSAVLSRAIVALGFTANVVGRGAAYRIAALPSGPLTRAK